MLAEGQPKRANASLNAARFNLRHLATGPYPSDDNNCQAVGNRAADVSVLISPDAFAVNLRIADGQFSLRGGSEVHWELLWPRPPLTGKVFLERWGAKTAAQLVARFQEAKFSFAQAGLADDEDIVHITACLLQVNGAKAGSQALTRGTSTVIDSIVEYA